MVYSFSGPRLSAIFYILYEHGSALSGLKIHFANLNHADFQQPNNQCLYGAGFTNR